MNHAPVFVHGIEGDLLQSQDIAGTIVEVVELQLERGLLINGPPGILSLGSNRDILEELVFIDQGSLWVGIGGVTKGLEALVGEL